MSLDLLKVVSYSDIPDLIKWKWTIEQLNILKDYFWIKAIKRNNWFEWVDNSSVDWLYQVTDSNDKVWIFIDWVWMLKLQKDKFFVDRVNAARNNFELSNKHNPELFHKSIDYIVSFDWNNICWFIRFIWENDFQKVPKVWTNWDYNFVSEEELSRAISIFYQQRNWATFVSNIVN